MNKLHASLPTIVKKYVWNFKYRLRRVPRWIVPDDVLSYLSVRLPTNSSVLDLGCGRGSLLRAMRNQGWTGSYCGVDIAVKAIEEGSKALDQRSSWVASDFESFRSPFYWDRIAMIESICYMKLEELPAFLERMMGMLSVDGMFVFRLHDHGKHREYVETATRMFPRIERVSESLLVISNHAFRNIEAAG